MIFRVILFKFNHKSFELSFLILQKKILLQRWIFQLYYKDLIFFCTLSANSFLQQRKQNIATMPLLDVCTAALTDGASSSHCHAHEVDTSFCAGTSFIFLENVKFDKKMHIFNLFCNFIHVSSKKMCINFFIFQVLSVKILFFWFLGTEKHCHVDTSFSILNRNAMCNSVSCRNAVADSKGKFLQDSDGTLWKCALAGVDPNLSVKCIQLSCRDGPLLGWYDYEKDTCYGKMGTEDGTIVKDFPYGHERDFGYLFLVLFRLVTILYHYYHYLVGFCKLKSLGRVVRM